MKKHDSRSILKTLLVIAMSFVSVASISVASAKYSSITGADWNGQNIFGKAFNTFNRFIDNKKYCFELGHFKNNVCENDQYADEREFLTVRKIGRALADGTVQVTIPSPVDNPAPSYHDYTFNDLQEGDVVRAYIFAHNNASTFVGDDRYLARDVRLSLTTQGNRVIGQIKAKNTFGEDPSTEQFAQYNAGKLLNQETTYDDDATVQLPAGLTLEIYKRSDSSINGLVACPASSACPNNKLGDPMQFPSDKFTFVNNVLTYFHGNMVGSQVNSVWLKVDLKVVKSNGNGNGNNNNNNGNNNNHERPDTYQECVDGTTRVRFTWDEAQSGDTLSVYKTPKNSTSEELYVYTVSSTYGTVSSTNLRNSSGQALVLQPGDKVRWQVGSGSRQSVSHSATIQDCMNLQDNLHLDLSRMVPCARPLYNPYFAWNTPALTKRLDVSTTADFAEYWTKDISNVNSTTGPEGFAFMDQRNKTLEFRGNVTYYWRIRESGKVYPGPSFRVPLCPDVECEVLNGGNSAACQNNNIVHTNMTECKPGICACVEIAVNPASAGDFNTVTFTTKVSNLTTDTVSRRVEIKNLRPDEKKGYTLTAILPGNQYVEFDSTCTSSTTPLGGKCDPKEQGDFEITGVKVTPHPTANRNTTYSDAASNPITVEQQQLSEFINNKSKPLIIRNLYPGDYADIEVTGVARTSKAGKEFAEGTDKVNYNFFMKSQSNGGVQKLVIARPFLLTVNDGDVITSAILKGFSNLEAVYKNTFGVDFRAISGFSYDPKTNPNVQSQVNQQNLGFGNNLRGLTIIADTPKTAGTELSITSESDFSKLNIRPDQTRIFSTKNQKLTFGSEAQEKLELSNSSTIYVRDADVTINSDIVYKPGTNTPAFALVVENGKIFVHPKVKQLDGVFVVLGNSATARISGTPNWKSYYETSKQQPKTLTVNGALYGNIDDLIPSRPNAAISGSSFDAIKKSAGIAINFDGRIYSFPPPGLKEIIGGVYELLRNTK